MQLTLSVLDLAPVGEGSDVGSSLHACVTLAQQAERLGYRRVWYAEHHNMPSIASAATSVLIAHVAAHTTTVRLGAGGIMLPNHAPLLIAEQFGTLASLHPDRIDLALGRAPGTDQRTLHALRRSPASAETFPNDVLELQGHLRGTSRIPGVDAYPGKGTNVPLWILGSSMFGAQLAAALGLPYGFASHFAPEALDVAVSTYREQFQASDQLEEPYVMAAVNAVIADTQDEADELVRHAKRARARRMFGRQRELTEADLDALLASPAGRAVDERFTYLAAGIPQAAASYVRDFARKADADEVIIVPATMDGPSRLTTLELLAQACVGDT